MDKNLDNLVLNYLNSNPSLNSEVRSFLENKRDILQNLYKHNQIHLLNDINGLQDNELKQYFECLNEIDFDLMEMLYNELILNPKGTPSEKNVITPIQNKLPLKDISKKEFEELRDLGLNLISQGKVGVVLLSGGQGTRLGFEHPKGMYNIGMPSGKTLFEYFANKIARVSEISHEIFGNNKNQIIWYLMTSEMNHQEIINYFAEHNYFGLTQESVKFFTQQSLPALDLKGKIILENKNKIHMSPNGNGGLFSSMFRHGILHDMKQRGIKYVHIFGVDNVLAKPADPFFIGITEKNQYEVACKYVPKKHPEEKVGVHVLSNGAPAVVEYSEISKEMAYQVDAQGNLIYDASHIVNSVYTIEFLEHIVTKGLKQLAQQYHLAKKKIKFYDNDRKETITPSDNNGYKFELFIFDILPLSKSEHFGLVEVMREEEFAPVKNSPGALDDSPDTARELLSKLHQRWLEKQGVKFDKKASKETENLFEIDFSQIYDEEDPKLKSLIDNHLNETIMLPCFIKN